MSTNLSKAKKAIVVGAGFSSLSSACYLSKMGYEVEVLEKNSQAGGRARQLIKEGFTFDIGPTFYWMPDVFETFFQDFGKRVADYYELERVDPSYKVFFSKKKQISVSSDFDELVDQFESEERGSGQRLRKFIQEAGDNYDLAIRKLVYQPGERLTEITTWETFKKLSLFFKSIRSIVRRRFKSPELRKILEFPVLFLGAHPGNTPAFYNFMNYADLSLGTWYPKGGMYSVVEAMVSLAQSLGVKITTSSDVRGFEFENGKIVSVKTEDRTIPCDLVLSGADYAFTESLLPTNYRQYSEKYWGKRTFAPSALLFYVGFNKKLKNVEHHTLFFDVDFEEHSNAIYSDKKWPKEPLFYASFPSISESELAPDGKEAGIFLVPLANDIEDRPEIRAKYFNILMDRLEELTDQPLKDEILFHESYCINDFKKDYNSYGGNAYGLANTLFQTHILRPKLKSKKVKNLYFTGQLTVPGPGVPPSLISGKIVSELIKKYE